VALVFLLAWVKHYDDQDIDGFTPLHLAVKSTDSLKHTRPVKALLIRGASRTVKDRQDRMPCDLIKEIGSATLRQNLTEDLRQPSNLDCYMIKNPLKKVSQSYTTAILMWMLMIGVYASLTLFVFPFYMMQKPTLLYLYSTFAITFFLHLIATCKDPGQIRKPTGISFMQMLEQFDPVFLCPDCEIVRTDRSRHCPICNKCIERFDHHCPWIHSCVGTGNHGWFVGFILSMYTLLISTISVLAINIDCAQNIGYDRYNFFVPTMLPAAWYDPITVDAFMYLSLAISCLFTLPLSLLVYIQMVNLCKSRTTQERFSKRMAPQSRTSYYLAQTQQGTAEPALVSTQQIEELMLIGDNS
jgi:palmitoyltransferase ZDHHC13/17